MNYLKTKIVFPLASAFYPILFDFYKPGYVSCWITQDKYLLDSLVIGLNYLIPLLFVFVANIIYFIKTRNFLRAIFNDVIEKNNTIYNNDK